MSYSSIVRPLETLGLLLVGLCFSACSSSSDSNGSSGGCGSLDVGGKKYALLFACDVPNLFGTGAHLCTEFYSNVPQVTTTFKALCSAEQGTVSGHCPTENSFGSCTVSSTTGSGSQGAIEATFGYPDSRGSGSAAAFERDCDSGSVYAPPGAPPASTAPTGSMVTSTCPHAGGVAFSMATLVNGEYLECTNYVGSVTADQLASVLKIGATTSPCPEANALCACTKNKAGTFGTDATLVYYKTSMASSSKSCDGIASMCDAYTESYRAP
ncbi:MAG TPA: hypothetical protein VGC79_28425 [Polyangiaceae bacterium]